jgi:hypothetical protein
MTEEAEEPDLHPALRELTDDSLRRQGPDSHPSPETLTAYHAGELSAAAADAVQEHLATCRHCADLLLDLPAFLDPPADPASGLAHAAPSTLHHFPPFPAATAGGSSPAADGAPTSLDASPPAPLPAPTAEEADRTWQEIRRRLPPAPAPAPRRWRRTYLLAAVLAFAAIATPLWIVAGRMLAGPLSPEVKSLSPEEPHRGLAAPSRRPTLIRRNAASTSLVLYLAHDLTGRPIVVGIRRELPRPDPFASSSGFHDPRIPPRPIDAHTLLLVLAHRELPPGRYLIRVLDAAHPDAEPLGEYPIEVQP